MCGHWRCVLAPALVACSYCLSLSLSFSHPFCVRAPACAMSRHTQGLEHSHVSVSFVWEGFCALTQRKPIVFSDFHYTDRLNRLSHSLSQATEHTHTHAVTHFEPKECVVVQIFRRSHAECGCVYTAIEWDWFGRGVVATDKMIFHVWMECYADAYDYPLSAFGRSLSDYWSNHQHMIHIVCLVFFLLCMTSLTWVQTQNGNGMWEGRRLRSVCNAHCSYWFSPRVCVSSAQQRTRAHTKAATYASSPTTQVVRNWLRCILQVFVHYRWWFISTHIRPKVFLKL